MMIQGRTAGTGLQPCILLPGDIYGMTHKIAYLLAAFVNCLMQNDTLHVHCSVLELQTWQG